MLLPLFYYADYAAARYAMVKIIAIRHAAVAALLLLRCSLAIRFFFFAVAAAITRLSLR